MPGVIARNRTATLLLMALMFAVALAATVMLAKHGAVHAGVGALSAKPDYLFHG